MNTRPDHARFDRFLAWAQRLADVQRRYPTMIPENVKAVAIAEAYAGPINEHECLAEGYDEQQERIEREQDYEGNGGFK